MGSRFWTKRSAALAVLAAVAALVLAACGNSSPPKNHGPLTPADSDSYTGPVTTQTYFQYLGWTGSLSMSAVNMSTSQESSSSLSGHAWMILASGAGGISGSSSTRQVTYDQVAITNRQGETIQLKLPAHEFAFFQKANARPSATLEFVNNTYYTKETGDNNSIFTVGEDDLALSDQADPAWWYNRLSTEQFLARYIKQVNITLTPQQFRQLNTPGVDAVEMGS